MEDYNSQDTVPRNYLEIPEHYEIVQNAEQSKQHREDEAETAAGLKGKLVIGAALTPVLGAAVTLYCTRR